jgi:hypothetical protein
MFQPYKAIIRQHIYEKFYPTAHYSNIFFSYVFVIFFLYSQTSVHELNSFLKVVRKPKLFSPQELMLNGIIRY